VDDGVFRLQKALSVVKVKGEAQSQIFTLEKGAEVRLIGRSQSYSTFVEVLHQGERYNMFEQDLKAHSIPVSAPTERHTQWSA
jgi:hypothetical protein